MTPAGPDSGVGQARSLELDGLSANQKIQGLLPMCNAKPPFQVGGVSLCIGSLEFGALFCCALGDIAVQLVWRKMLL